MSEVTIQELAAKRAKVRAELIEEQIKACQEVAIFPIDIKVPSVFGGFEVYHIEGKPAKWRKHFYEG